jgi:hypothetical protein
MSKRVIPKFNTFTFVTVLILALNKVTKAYFTQLSKAYVALKSNLPMNRTGNPCNHLYATNQRILPWLSSDNQSAHLYVKLNLFNKSA